MAVLEVYLPKRLSAEEIQAEVAAIVAEVGATGAGDMGKVMVAVKTRLAGKADMGLKLKHEAALLELQRVHEELQAEQRNSQRLLYAMLPRSVARRLLDGEQDASSEYEELSILISDVVGFSPTASRMTPREVSSFLSELYSRFDLLIESPRFAASGMYKVETVGDAYVAVCNLEQPVDDHADVLLEFAREMHAAAAEVKALDAPTRLRIGLHTGAAVGGVIGALISRHFSAA
jgi:guanylate cyclase soluble subunit beta